MAIIRPFRALRPADGLASRVAALPYDVYNREEARIEAAKDPLSFLNIDRPETQFEEGHDLYAADVYRKADRMISAETEEGVFVREDSACYYIWCLTMNGRDQTGLVALSSVDDYENGVIRRHESTRKEKEEDRFHHIDTTSCQTGPIFLAYRSHSEVSSLVEEKMTEPCLYDFTADDGIRHRVWRIDRPDRISALTKAFAGLDHTYIADGHHRAASAVSVSRKRREEHPDYTGEEEFNYFLSVLFPDNELKIMDYNRVLKDLNGLTEEEALKRLGEVFRIEEAGQAPCRPDKKGIIGLYLGTKWYKLTVLPELVKDDPIGILDVEYLQREALEPVFGIQDPRTDPRIDFVGGIRGLEELERRCREDCKCAFAMYPTSISELFRVADAGLLMPPKSTWFEPKLRSGLFLHQIER
ncbi:MAG: DUF1015 family protein [Eubacterium sp.]|nr:DUF1015 family protein [Eubacterium sp.]